MTRRIVRLDIPGGTRRAGIPGAKGRNDTADYEYTESNIIGYWTRLALFIFDFALLAAVTLAFIDQDKR